MIINGLGPYDKTFLSVIYQQTYDDKNIKECGILIRYSVIASLLIENS